ncbi:sialate O-acetylesterase [Chitinophaga sp. Mgbs1]|uniref:Sialate O-acetylesterase n=1 Tax=Chitinophaga solisilvae TaxID=1233460 RepID=A0A433WGV7_9BACT|nr:sialate O-acetylesterase [Chitinophaga solisilvae]
MKKTWMILSCLAIVLRVSANVTLPAFFTDGMVLQRNQPLYIWGWSDKHEKVTVRFRQQQQSVKAGSDGRWMVKLQPEAAGGPFALTVSGKNTIALKDVLVGEVWICSGQSNMEFQVKDVTNAAAEIKNAGYPEIREFTVKRMVAKEPQQDVMPGAWLPATTAHVAEYSAVSYFFARELFQRLHVPVGLIHTSWGGTQVEAWISKAGFLNSNEFREMMSQPWGIDSIKGPNSYPGALFNAMIHPLIPYAVKGAIWYQGESNVTRAWQYRTSFPLMIADWRSRWQQPAFPFYFVQLTSFDANHGKREGNSANGSTWAELREAQQQTLSVPGTGMAVTTDIGEEKDIHPRNKQDVGKRLAVNVLKNVYAQEIVPGGPVFSKMDISGNKALISFADPGAGLIVQDRYGYIRGFEAAGEDQHFYYAQAQLQEGRVVVTCDQVSRPVAVRYNWADVTDGNLFNREGYPAAPFRTDQWKVSTQDVKYRMPDK